MTTSELVVSIVKLIISVAIFILMDYLSNLAVGLMFIWIISLSIAWSIIMAFLGIWVLFFFVYLISLKANYAVDTNEFKVLSATLICVYLILTCIFMVIKFCRLFDFDITKEAIAGVGMILYFLVKTLYACRAAWLGKYISLDPPI